MRLRGRKVWVIFFACVLAGGTTGVVTSAVRGGNGKETLDPAAVEAATASGVAVKVATFPPLAGREGRAVFMRKTSNGLLCLWDAPDGRREGPGGCNRASDPFGGRKMMISLAWDGGPALSTITDARLIGIVAVDVDAVTVRMSDGSTRSVALTGSQAGTHSDFYRAFAYRVQPADIRAGIEPISVSAFDDTGKLIDQQNTGLR